MRRSSVRCCVTRGWWTPDPGRGKNQVSGRETRRDDAGTLILQRRKEPLIALISQIDLDWKTPRFLEMRLKFEGFLFSTRTRAELECGKRSNLKNKE